MSKKDKFNAWPYAIMLSFVAIIAACVHTVMIALDNPVHEDGFMGKYQDVDHSYNEIQISQAKFDEKYQIYIAEFKSSGNLDTTIIKPKTQSRLSELKFNRKFLRSLREDGISQQNLDNFTSNYEISKGDKVSFKIAFEPSLDKMNAKISLTRPETDKLDVDLSAKTQNGFISVDEFEIPQTGRWQVVARLDDGENVGFYKFEFIGVKK